jgi:hypothetical protein
MNYTKGHWTITQTQSGTLSILSSDAKPIALLQLRVPPYDDNFVRDCNELKGNAHLIAAAPDMYAALKLLMERFAEMNGKYSYPMSLDLPRVWAEKALAKAEGK